MLAGKRNFRVSLELTHLYSIDKSNIIVCVYIFGQSTHVSVHDLSLSC